MLKREAEDDRDLGNPERAQVWSNAYNLAAGDGDAAFVDQRMIEDQHRALDIVLDAFDALAARARVAGVEIRDGWTPTVDRIRHQVRN